MLYARGEIGDPNARALLAAIELFERAHENDEAYKEVIFKLDQVEKELEASLMSPGRRASLRASAPNMAGQEPRDRSEPPSSAQ